MKKKHLYFSGILFLALCILIYFHYNYQKEAYILFSSSTNNTLIEKLEKNDITYKIITSGKIIIMKKDIDKAILCCT